MDDIALSFLVMYMVFSPEQKFNLESIDSTFLQKLQKSGTKQVRNNQHINNIYKQDGFYSFAYMKCVLIILLQIKMSLDL